MRSSEYQADHLQPVTNFSQNACKARYDALQDGTAKATPESVSNPGTEMRARVMARKEKEARITKDEITFQSKAHENAEQIALAKANWKGNAWTSKNKLYD